MQLGVERLTLPAAPAALNTWIMGFDFKPMEDAELRRLTEDTKMLIFPGTRVLHKVRYLRVQGLSRCAGSPLQQSLGFPFALCRMH